MSQWHLELYVLPNFNDLFSLDFVKKKKKIKACKISWDRNAAKLKPVIVIMVIEIVNR